MSPTRSPRAPARTRSSRTIEALVRERALDRPGVKAGASNRRAGERHSPGHFVVCERRGSREKIAHQGPHVGRSGKRRVRVADSCERDGRVDVGEAAVERAPQRALIYLETDVRIRKMPRNRSPRLKRPSQSSQRLHVGAGPVDAKAAGYRSSIARILEPADVEPLSEAIQIRAKRFSRRRCT